MSVCVCIFYVWNLVSGQDFVKIMNEELSLAGEASRPDVYYRVFREPEGAAGRFFSHIEQIPWEDM